MSCKLDYYPCDFYEAQFIRYIRKRLPSYERFWSEFVRPLRIPGRTRILAAPEQEQMAEAHYSVFWHLVNAWRLRQKLEQPSEADSLLVARPAVDALFFHMGAAADMVEEFLYRWWVIELRIASGNREAKPVCAKMGEEQIVDKARAYHGEKYSKDLKELEKPGRPVKIDLHDKTDLYLGFLKSAGVPAEKAHKRFQTEADRMRQYRNDIAHGAMLASGLDEDLVLIVPRREVVRGRTSWFDLRRVAKGGKKAKDGKPVFTPAVVLVDEFLGGLEKRINDLLDEVTPHCRKLAEDVVYQQWLAEARRSFAATHGQVEKGRPGRLVPGRSISGSLMGADHDDNTSLALSTDSGGM